MKSETDLFVETINKALSKYHKASGMSPACVLVTQEDFNRLLNDLIIFTSPFDCSLVPIITSPLVPSGTFWVVDQTTFKNVLKTEKKERRALTSKRRRK